MEKKTCPLKQNVIFSEHDSMTLREYSPVACNKEKCSWWIHQGNCCAIVGIVSVLENISIK